MSDEKLISEVEEILKEIEAETHSRLLGSGGGGDGGGSDPVGYGVAKVPAVPEVPAHIKKTVEGIRSFGHQWAEQIEAGAKEQLEADTKRYEDSMALAKRIREDADAEAEHVQKWAITTRDASLIQREAFAKLNGGGVAKAPAEKNHET